MWYSIEDDPSAYYAIEAVKVRCPKAEHMNFTSVGDAVWFMTKAVKEGKKDAIPTKITISDVPLFDGGPSGEREKAVQEQVDAQPVRHVAFAKYIRETCKALGIAPPRIAIMSTGHYQRGVDEEALKEACKAEDITCILKHDKKVIDKMQKFLVGAVRKRIR